MTIITITDESVNITIVLWITRTDMLFRGMLLNKNTSMLVII